MASTASTGQTTATTSQTTNTAGNVTEDGEELYCICRRPYIPGMFMIGCEKCQEWYHGECVGITKRDAKRIEQYICDKCYALEDARRRNYNSGPRCLNSTCYQRARVGSKYCSEACGVAYALELIEQQKRAEEDARREEEDAQLEAEVSALLDQIENNKEITTTLSAADKEDLQALLELRNTKEQLKAQLKELEARMKEFDDLLKRLREMPDPSDEEIQTHLANQEHKQIGPEVLDCVSCGQPIPLSKFSRHIETCYYKTEAHHPILGFAPTVSGDGSNIVYCDIFDSKTRSFCKKLKASCPLHNAYFVRFFISISSPQEVLCEAIQQLATTKKALKAQQICGCPTNDPEFQPDGICKLRKQDCQKHIQWESLRKAELILEDISLACMYEERVLRERLLARRTPS